ncbi:hypothetical protein [Streptomyces sp. 2A115]|uniref:hypothetical protein n=1 Tax=Streptomyces sp. 2A115 TaxID=3457439 RepID=UPI003FCFF25D
MVEPKDVNDLQEESAMNRSARPPRRTSRAGTRARVLASVLAAAALLTVTAGCSDGDGAGSGNGEVGGSDDAAVSPSPVGVQAPSAAASPSVTVARTLTETQARAALITNADLGEEWAPTQGAATWRDGLLKGETDVADCQKLLDGLYAEDLLGEPAGARAVRGFDDSDYGAQLRYQVAAYDRAALDTSLSWLKTLPETCERFTATNAQGRPRTVHVAGVRLPDVGEAREGLTVTVTDETMTDETDGMPITLTLDFAAVRVGDNALSLTNGGLDGVDDDPTEQAAGLGAQRLEDVLAGRTPAAQPANEQD